MAALIPLVSIEREPLKVWGDDQSVRGWPLPTAPAFPPPAELPEPVSVAVDFDMVTFGATYGLWVYVLFTAVFVGRLALNLRRLLRQTSANPRQPFRGATLVLLPTDTLPYTFLHYLFVSEAAYQRRAIEEELFTHELAHIRQRHSLDVLLLEVLLCVAWFNPVLYGIKQTMQLNHEFLADQAVNERHQNVPRYRQLLLDKVAGGLPGSLTSAFAFRTTQKRFLMMTKPTSHLRAWLLGGSAALLLEALGFLFGTETEPASKVDPAHSNAKARQPVASEAEYAALSAAAKPRGIVRRPNVAPAQSLETAAERTARLYDEQIARGGHEKKYADLSAEEKQWVRVVENKPLLRRTPTAAQWQAWQTPRQFRVWAEGKWLQGPALTTRYQRTAIASFLISNITKELRQREGYVQQVHLTTNQEYAAYHKTPATPYYVVVLKPTYSIK